MPYYDLREFMDACAAAGEMVTIDTEVHWNLEAGAIMRRIYRTFPVLGIKKPEDTQDYWNITYVPIFHMANDSALFHTRQQLVNEGWQLIGNVFRKDADTYLPLYEAKMTHHFDHRFGDYADYPEGALTSHLPDIPTERLQDPCYGVQPRYWILEDEVNRALGARWPYLWLFGWRDICRSTDERTVIGACLPKVGVGKSILGADKIRRNQSADIDWARPKKRRGRPEARG